jgi:kinesin family member 11
MHFLLSKNSCKLLVSLLDSLKLDHGIRENVKSIVMTSRAQLHDLEHGHYEMTKAITGNADRSLGEDYKVSDTYRLKEEG